MRKPRYPLSSSGVDLDPQQVLGSCVVQYSRAYEPTRHLRDTGRFWRDGRRPDVGWELAQVELC